jgi:UDP-glucose 4-epimerase
MKILVTGATGLVGTNLVNELDKKHEVFKMSRKLSMDLRDKDLAKVIIGTFKPEVVYHLAANAAEARGQISPQDMTEENLNIFLNTLVPFINAKGKRFIYTSSISVYGDVPAPYSDDYHPEPKDVYGINKLACEQILKVMAKVYNFEYVIVRPHNIYGPHQNMNDPYRNVIALFMRRLLEGQSYKLFGEGKMIRQFSYVDDVVSVLEQAIDKFTNQTFNLGSDLISTIKEISDELIGITGIEPAIEYAPARPQEILEFVASHTRQNSLTIYHETPLLIGLSQTWQWAKQQKLGELIQREDEIK